MHAFQGDDWARAGETEPDAWLRARTAAADAAFVADGVALGLPLEWAGQVPLLDEWKPRVVAGDRLAAPAPRDARPVLSVVAGQATGRPAWPTAGSPWRT